jgi:hypothetical protein
MAVPGSGEISISKIAKEFIHDDYNNSSSPPSEISLQKLSTHAADGTFDATNLESPNHPDGNASHGMSEFYSYDHDYVPIPCNKAMDVVFLIDYTYSMNTGNPAHINVMKTNVAAISSKVVSESGGDYRLAAVLIDQRSTTPTYWTGNNTAVANLNSANKYNSGTVWLSAVVPFANTNKSDFDTKIGYLAGSSNSSTSMLIGTGAGGPEPNDTAIDRVLNNSLAGSFRSGVTRMIILITDNSPDGDGDDLFQGAEETTKMGTLSNQAVAAVTTISVLGTFSNSTSSDGTTTRYDIYNAYANNTGGLTNFAGDPSDIEQFIEDICDDIGTNFATVSTSNATSVTSSGFTMNGSISSQGGSTVTSRGFVRAISNINLFIGSFGVTNTTVGSGTGNFTSSVTGLPSGNSYYYKAYATNSTGTSYGESKLVTTSSVTYTTRYVDGPHAKNFFACYQTPTDIIKFTGIFQNGTTVYDNNLNLITAAGWYNGPVTSSGASTTNVFYINSSGVVSNITLGLC